MNAYLRTVFATRPVVEIATGDLITIEHSARCPAPGMQPKLVMLHPAEQTNKDIELRGHLRKSRDVARPFDRAPIPHRRFPFYVRAPHRAAAAKLPSYAVAAERRAPYSPAQPPVRVRSVNFWRADPTTGLARRGCVN